MQWHEDLSRALELIHQRRNSMIPKLSFRKAAATAARLSDMTWGESTWRGIESGANRPSPERVAIMALTVGVTPEELAGVGAAETARLLSAEIRRRADQEPALADIDRDATSESVIQALLQSLDEIRNSGANTEERRELERELLGRVMAEIRGQLDRFRSQMARDENGPT